MKSPLKQIQEKLWKECKRIILKKYDNTCYTCGATNLSGSNCQLGHFIPSHYCGPFLRYDIRCLRIQCMFCNMRLGGNGAVFYRNLVQEVGQEEVDNIFKDFDNRKEVKIKPLDFYTKLLEQYKKL
jgi:hypothetical protein